MHWYDGTIAEAVALSKQRNAIFVVFIEGDNDLSAEMAATIDSSDVLKRLADPARFLAIKLMSGSPHYTHFAQIYQFVPVPSLFFIGRNGTPLEVVCAGVQPENLATRIDRILEQHLKDKPGVHGAASSSDIKQQTTELLNAEAVQPGPASKQHAQPETSSEPPSKVQKTEHNIITRSGKEYNVVCDGDVCTRVPRVAPSEPGPSANVLIREPNTQKIEESIPPKSQTAKEAQKPPTETPKSPTETPKPPTETPKSPTETPKPPTGILKLPTEAKPPSEAPDVPTEGGNVDDKIERAKELIEARRREKAAKEKELEIQKEMERRATGQGLTELKQWQQDQQLKQIQEERKREKMENNLARQRILEQIAQDRAERRARDQPAVVAQPVLAQPTLAQPAASHAANTAGDAQLCGTARLQFKLPDGSSHTAHFDAAGTLQDVHVYVADNLQLSSSHFSLWTMFPRRELTEPTATLRNLQLTPSAALLVLPRRTNNSVASTSSISNIITFLTQVFTSLILDPSQQLFAWLRARLSGDPPPAPSARAPQTPPRAAHTGDARPAAQAGLRRRGNIHRLGEEKSPDDDNNTWNGNSTQQM